MHEVDRSPLSDVEVKNEWSHSPIPYTLSCRVLRQLTYVYFTLKYVKLQNGTFVPEEGELA